MSNWIDYIYNNFLYNPFIYVVSFFVNEKYGIFILIAVVVVLSIIQGKVIPKLAGKNNYLGYLPKLLNFVVILTVFLTAAVGFFKYQSDITAFFKSNSTKNNQTTPTQPQNNTQKKTTPQQDTVETQGVTPETQNYQQKQLYYAVSCSTCWNQACPHNGYSYGGYDEYNYIFYKSLCQSCNCNNYKAQSFWR